MARTTCPTGKRGFAKSTDAATARQRLNRAQRFREDDAATWSEDP